VRADANKTSARLLKRDGLRIESGSGEVLDPIAEMV
jgi:hypothetical protein